MEKPILHIIAPFHTIPNHDYDHCAFTGKVLRFAKMMQKQGYIVIEYSNGESISGANEQVQILTAQRVKEYTKEVHDFMLLAKMGTPMWQEFDTKLKVELGKRVKQHDIICHPFGPSHSDLVRLFPQAYHVETGIGYDSGDFGAFRIFESYAWMHFHQGKDDVYDAAGKFVARGRRGKAYEWVVPNYYNLEDWEPRYEKGGDIIYFGRVVEGKGLYVVQEISKHFNQKIHVYGMGDSTPFQAPNMVFHGPITGQKNRSDILRNAKVVIMPTQFTEPFGGVAVEAQFCGTPVVTTDYGAFPETIEHGKTGFRCHTLGDFLAAIVTSETLDRKYISDRARSLYSTDRVGEMYDAVFKQIYDLRGAGWYTLGSHYIKEVPLLWEQQWWGDCTNTYEEEEKQKVYLKYMGLDIVGNKIYVPNNPTPRILDIGGGPVSALLKVQGLVEGKVYDPSTYPNWTIERYKEHKIEYVKKGGEEVDETGFDEVWIYNCLQHVQDPKKIIENAKRAGKILRIFEWIDLPKMIGHPISLNQKDLEEWIGQPGIAANIFEGGATGRAFYGVFNFSKS